MSELSFNFINSFKFGKPYCSDSNFYIFLVFKLVNNIFLKVNTSRICFDGYLT